MSQLRTWRTWQTGAWYTPPKYTRWAAWGSVLGRVLADLAAGARYTPPKFTCCAAWEFATGRGGLCDLFNETLSAHASDVTHQVVGYIQGGQVASRFCGEAQKCFERAAWARP